MQDNQMIRVPFSEFLKGASTRENHNFRRGSKKVYFLDPAAEGETRESKWRDGPKGKDIVQPVYEIQSCDFDQWSVINSLQIQYQRIFGFSQYISVDGSLLAAGETRQRMDAMRRAIPQVLNQRDRFLDEKRYLEIAEYETRQLTSDNLVLSAVQPVAERVSEAMGYFVLRLWENCWKRIAFVRENRSSWNNGGNPVRVLIASLNSYEAGRDYLEDCVSFLLNRAAPALPPQVLSMLSVTLGANASSLNWRDSACLVYSDSALIKSGRETMFDFSDAGNEKTPEDWMDAFDWERELARLLAEHKLPEYFAEIDRATDRIDIRSDFNLLRWGMRAEIFFREIQGSLDSDYEAYKKASYLLGQMFNTLTKVYGVNAKTAHSWMMKAEQMLVEKSRYFRGNLDESEYMDLAYIFSEVESDYPELADEYLEALTAQRKFYDSKQLISMKEEIQGMKTLYHALLRAEVENDVNSGAIDEAEYVRWVKIYLDESVPQPLRDLIAKKIGSQISMYDTRRPSLEVLAEISGREDLYLDGLTVELLGNELSALKGKSLTPAEYRMWAGRYLVVDNANKNELTDGIGELLSGQLRFADSDETPLNIAEEYSLDVVVKKIICGLLDDYHTRAGSLSLDEYREVLKHYANNSRQHWLDEAREAKADELLLGQSGFAGLAVRTAELLQEAQLNDHWNRMIETECDKALKDSDMLDDQSYNFWRAQLGYTEIRPQTEQKIIDMIVRKTLKDRLADYLDMAAADGQSALEERMIQQMLDNVGGDGNRMTAEEYCWWMERWDEATRAGSPYEQEIFGMLLKQNIKDGNPLTLAKETGRWRLLNDLALEKVGKGQIPNDEYDEWIDFYLELQSKYYDDGKKALGAIEEHLLDAVDENGVQLLKAKGARNLYWKGVRKLLDRVVSFENTKNLTADSFGDWLALLREALDEGEDISTSIHALLKDQYRIRDNDNMYGYAYERAAAAGAPKELLLDLIRTEHRNLPETNSMRDLEMFRRWVGHYGLLAEQGVPLAEDVAKRLCEKSIIDGHYVLGTALNGAAERLEGRILEREKEASRKYSREEYLERLRLCFEHTNYSEVYFELLTSDKSGDASFEWYAEFLNNSVRMMTDERLRFAARLFESLSKYIGNANRKTIDDLRAVISDERIQEAVFKSNQEGLKKLVKQCLNLKIGLEGTRCFYRLLDERLDELERQIAREVAEALEIGAEGNADMAGILSDYTKTIEKSLAGQIGEAVESQLRNKEIRGDMLLRAVTLFREIRFTTPAAAEIISKLLRRSNGTGGISEILRFADGYDEEIRRNMLDAAVEWLKNTSGQSFEIAEELLRYAQEAKADQDPALNMKMFEAFRMFLANGNDCSGVSPDIYELICRMWEDQAEFPEVQFFLFEKNELLTGAMRDSVMKLMNVGTVKADGRFARVIECRNECEMQQFQAFMDTIDSFEKMLEQLNDGALPWLEEDSFGRVYTENTARKLYGLIVDEANKRKESENVAGSSTPLLSALNSLLDDERMVKLGRQWREKIGEQLDALIAKSLTECYASCCRTFTGQNDDGIDKAFEQLDRLLTQIKVEDTAELSHMTVKWCEEYGRKTLNGSMSASDALIRDIHANRKDMNNLGRFCERVYDKYLVANDIASPSAVYSLIAAAKVMGIDNFWHTYILLAMKRKTADSIWAGGNEALVLQTVIYVYNLLGEQNDGVVSRESLESFCAEDRNFMQHAKKQKNGTMLEIIRRANQHSEKRGFFGLFKR